jgi:hypothetical protein
MVAPRVTSPTRQGRGGGAAPLSGGVAYVTRLRPSTRALIVLGALLIATAAFLYYETRGTTFWFDEWIWVLHRRGNDLGTFLRPHNNHLSLVPIAIYRILLATVGMNHYAPYRLLVIAGHLCCVGLLFVYARRRVGDFLALLAAALLLLLGPGSEDIIWPFQIAWLISIAAGLGALLLIDRGDRRGDVGACLLLGLSLASSGLGVAFVLGVAVDLLWGRRRWRDLWILAVPLVPYALWWIGYQDNHWQDAARAEGITDPLLSGILRMPGFIANSAGSAFSALTGLGGQVGLGRPPGGTFLSWGPPLLVLGVALALWRIARLRRVPPRVLSLLVIAVSFWGFTAITRGFISAPYTSRYLYFGVLLILMVAAELARGLVVPLRAQVLLGLLALGVVVANVGALRDAARDLRTQAQLTRAQLGALEIGRPLVKPDFVANAFFEIDAGSYFAAERAWGTPAPSPAALAAAPEYARKEADLQLIRIHRIAPQASSASPPLGARPAVDSVAGGSITDRGACIGLNPAAGSTAPSLGVRVPPSGLLLTADGGPATLSVRRFADEFQPVGSLAAASPTTLRIAPDLANQPWHLQLAPGERATVCGLA